MDETIKRCSFCLKTHEEVNHLIASKIEPVVFICDECAKECKRVMDEDIKKGCN